LQKKLQKKLQKNCIKIKNLDFFIYCKNNIEAMLKTTFFCFLFFILQTSFAQQTQLVGLEKYLQAVEIATTKNDKLASAQAYTELGNFYFSKNVFEKSINNHKIALDFWKELANTVGQIASLETIGKSYFATAHYQEANDVYLTLLDLYQKQDNAIGTEKTLENLVWASQNLNKFDKLLAYNIKLAEIAKKHKHTAIAAKATNNIAVYYMSIKNNNKALNYFSEALQLYQANGATENMPLLLLNMGSCYVAQKEFEKAENYYNQAINLYNTQNNKIGKALALNLLASNDLLQNKTEKSLLLAKDALHIATEQQADDVLAETYFVLSEIYNAEGDNKQSQNYYKLHIATKEKIAEALRQKQQANTQKELQAVQAEGEVKLTASEKAKQELALKQLVLEAEKNAKDLELKAKQVTLLEQEKQIQQQAFANQLLEKQRLALEKQRIAKDLEIAQQQIEQDKKQQQITLLEKDKEIQNTMQNLQAKEFEKKQQLDEAEKKFKDEEIANQKVKQFFIIGILLLVAILLVFAFYAFIKQRKGNRLLLQQQAEIKETNEELATTSEELRQNMEEMQTIQEQLQKQRDELLLFNQEVTKQKEIIEDKNSNIMASITYAKRIQSAFLPDKDILKKNIPDSFIFFQPKDIVSGDFYWFAEHNDKLIVTVADCTGHGVPGALMSLIGMNLLDEIIYMQNITNPAKVLTELDKGFKRQLQKPEVSINDGMDIAMCEVDKTNKTLSFAAAHCPLIIIQKEELKSIKGIRGAIGGDARIEKNFENHNFSIESPTYCYIFSDGFQDQFGGKGAFARKFLSSNLRELLGQNYTKPFAEQQLILKNTFEDWKGKETQTDDVLVIGFKIG
jgi:serine phosphatase RsbU (regulator of sigma subunit)